MTSYGILQHMYRALQQSPLKEIIEKTKFTKIEVTFDNASNYISKEFLYGCTKGLCKMYPHIK